MLAAYALQQLNQLDQIGGAEQCAPGRQLHSRVAGNDVRPTSRNRYQMLAFFMEVRSALAPRMEIGGQFLAGPGMKWMGDSETSIQTACIRGAVDGSSQTARGARRPSIRGGNRSRRCSRGETAERLLDAAQKTRGKVRGALPRTLPRGHPLDPPAFPSTPFSEKYLR